MKNKIITNAAYFAGKGGAQTCKSDQNAAACKAFQIKIRFKFPDKILIAFRNTSVMQCIDSLSSVYSFDFPADFSVFL